MSNDKMSSLVKEYLELDAEIKAQQLVAEEIKDQIKSEMTERGVEELEVDSHIVRYRDVLTSVFDKTRFKAKYEDLYALFLKQVQSKKFSIC